MIRSKGEELAEVGELLEILSSVGDRLARRLGSVDWNYGTAGRSYQVHGIEPEVLLALGGSERRLGPSGIPGLDSIDFDRFEVRVECPHGREVCMIYKKPACGD